MTHTHDDDDDWVKEPRRQKKKRRLKVDVEHDFNYMSADEVISALDEYDDDYVYCDE